MKNKYHIIICLALLGTLRCTSSKEDSIIPIEINIEKSVSNFEKLQISDYFDDVIYIPLCSDSILLGRLYQLNFKGKIIAVRDLNNCVLYDKTGSFISKIGNKGGGPQEYTSLINARIGYNARVFLQNYNSINVYDFDGKFIRKFVPEIPEINFEDIKSWALYNDSLFVAQIQNTTGKVKYKCAIFNSNGKIVKLFKNYILLNRQHPLKSTYDSHANIYQFKGQTYFKEMMNDTMFVINDQMKLKPVYFFNLGKYCQPIKERELGPLKMTENIDNYIFIKNIYESKYYLFLDCNFGNHSPAKRQIPVEKYGSISEYYTNSVLGIFDKGSGKLVFSKPIQEENHFLNTGFYNDFDNGLNFYPQESVNDSVFAMWVDAYILKAHISSEVFKNSTPKYPEKKKELEQLANSLDENDNPVLMLVKLKK